MGHEPDKRDRGTAAGAVALIRCAALVAVTLAAASCTPTSPSVLDPRGPAAARVTGLWWLLFAASSVVTLFVVGMIVLAIVRGRRKTPEEARGEVRWGEPFIVIAGVVVSGAVLVSVFGISVGVMQGLTNPDREPSLTIDVIGRDWWWEAVYPGGVVTANEIHIPAGEPVRLRLTTADVIHSFWVPQLAPKKDMVPGRTNEMWIEADEPGRYHGQCAEYCGLQHANMIVFVVADPPERFRSWLRNEAQPAREPEDPEAIRGREVFLSSTCRGCHAIRGTPADASLGPDLTHLMTRERIGAGVLPNAPGNLARWIVDPQDVKPGVTMPPSELSAEELSDLLAYLTTLT